MRRGDWCYWDGERPRSFDTTDLGYAQLLVAQLPSRVLEGIVRAGEQDGRVNPRDVVKSAKQELERRSRSELEFERARDTGTSARLRRQSWGFVI